MALSTDAEAHIERLRRELKPQCHPRFASLMTNALDLSVIPLVISYGTLIDLILETESLVSSTTGRHISFLSFFRTWMTPHTGHR